MNELEIQLKEFEDKWHFSSLEKIFIENKIYRDIEEEETWEGESTLTIQNLTHSTTIVIILIWVARRAHESYLVRDAPTEGRTAPSLEHRSSCLELIA